MPRTGRRRCGIGLGRQDLENRPWIDGVGLEQDVDCLRGTWDEQQQAMIATFRTWNEETVAIRPVVTALPPGTHGVDVDGELKRVAVSASRSEEIAVDLDVGDKDVDLVLLRA
jgi:hypothetical protein